MVILQKGKIPDGIAIQLEDWSLNRAPHPMTPPDLKVSKESFCLAIGLYPKAVQKYNYLAPGETFRLTISANRALNYTDAQLREDYEALLSGTKSISDLQEYFWNGEKDRWALGFTDEYPFETEVPDYE